MTYNTNERDAAALRLPITQAAHQTAQQFARRQPTPEKAEQVRLNTLAVWVVNDYLQMLGIPTAPLIGDSWNPVMCLCADVADLDVVGVGRLECRAVRPQAQTCPIPPEVWLDRVGYVVVEIDEPSREATVLGFTPAAAVEVLALKQLQPVEALIDHLNQLQQPRPLVTNAAIERSKVKLNQWLNNVFESGWQTVETLLNSGEPELAFRFRSVELVEHQEPTAPSIRRAKLIDLGIQRACHPIALVVEVKPGSERRRHISLQVHPVGQQLYLPPLLELTVLDESGLIFLQAQARTADDYIQLQFTGLPGEQFSARVSLGDASVAEDFVL